VPEPVAPKQYKDTYEAVFSALAHPARRRILITLNFEEGSMAAGEIAAVFEHSWPTTTRHLKILLKAGLITQEREGRGRIYRINRRRLELVRERLEWLSKKPS